MHRWEGIVRMVLRGIGREFEDWIHLAQDWNEWLTLVDMVTNVWVP
jgi:hypothetical protein